ncbi:MAG: Trm112 family protein [Betaproteobacteria bacterium]|nr:Trm112 family protein [Betaproteobacteria bacterium]
MDRKLLEILVCPECKGALKYDRANQELLCNHCQLAYPINEKGVPVMIADEARSLAEAEPES